MTPEERQRQDRAVLILTVVFTVLLALFAYFASGRDLATTLFIVPIVASVSFWTFRFSTGLGRRLAHSTPSSVLDLDAEEPARMTDRPEHARRRRERQRRRHSR